MRLPDNSLIKNVANYYGITSSGKITRKQKNDIKSILFVLKINSNKTNINYLYFL